MTRIVVGVDGSAPSVRALHWAATMTRTLDGELIVVNAYVPIQSEKPPGLVERLMAGRTRELEHWCADALTDIRHKLEVIEGDPRAALTAAVARHRGDLLVVAATGSSGSGPGFLHLGSVAEYLTHHSSVALAVIPGDAPPEAHRVVVAVDGSQHSLAAVRWLAELASSATELEIVAVAVAEDDRLDEETVSAGYSDPEDLVRSNWAAPLGEREIAFQTVVVRGVAPADGILRVAADHNADLIVLGMRGAGGITGLRLGGVAFKVAHRTDTTTVVLVPPDNTEQ